MRYRSRQPGGAWKDRFPDTRKRLSATRQRLSNKFTEKGAAVYFPGAPFMAAAILSLISLLLIVRTLRKNEH